MIFANSGHSLLKVKQSHILDKLVGPVNVRRGIRRSFREVEFVLNRFPLQCQHRALAMSATTSLQARLFPTMAKEERAVSRMGKELELFNKNIEQNKEQYQAVRMVWILTKVTLIIRWFHKPLQYQE